MKDKLFLITFLAITTLTVGCNREPTASEQIEKLTHDTKAVAQDLKNYEFAQKTEFSAAMKQQLAEINKDLNEIEAKLAKSSGTVKDQAKPKLQALRVQETELNKKLNEIENATESTWDAVKSGTVSAYNSFKDGLNQSRQWVSDKIAP